MTKIIFENAKICLCLVEEHETNPDNAGWFKEYADTPYVLFHKKTGDVLTENLMFWIAQNR